MSERIESPQNETLEQEFESILRDVTLLDEMKFSEDEQRLLNELGEWKDTSSRTSVLVGVPLNAR